MQKKTKGSLKRHVTRVILLMEKMLHQLIWQISHYLQGFIQVRWLAGFLPSTVSGTSGLLADDLFLSYIHPLAALSSSSLVGWRHEILDGFFDPGRSNGASVYKPRGQRMQTSTQRMHSCIREMLQNDHKICIVSSP